VYFFLILLVSCPVNRPSFRAFIRFYNEHTAQSVYDIDCSTSYQVLYYNTHNQHHIIFRTTGYLWSVGDSYYITLDEGVLFSNSIENSTEYLNPKFWRFKVIHPFIPSAH
jgi:hypothetical protein